MMKRYSEVTCMHLSLSSLMSEVDIPGATEHCQRIIFSQNAHPGAARIWYWIKFQ